MGANATTSVPSYVAGEVLTAADLNVTNSGIPVFADSTARTNGFGGTGEKALAEGQYAYLEDDNKTYVYDGAAWQQVGSAGLVLIKTQTIGTTVSSVTVTDAFSSSYDNYFVTINGGVASTDNSLLLTLGATATGYYYAGINMAYNSATVTGEVGANATKWDLVGRGSTNSLNGAFYLYDPNAVKNTHFSSIAARSTTTGSITMLTGYLANTTQYTAFTLTTNTGTITGGTIRVYGFANS